jgi:outer membrane protein assembly factor BamA
MPSEGAARRRSPSLPDRPTRSQVRMTSAPRSAPPHRRIDLRARLARLSNLARFRRFAPLAVVVVAWALGGCASIPKGAAAVDAVNVEGTNEVSSSDIEEKIATTPSPKFLFLFRGVIYDYEIFDRFVLQRDLARVERFYQSRGYYDAHARAGRVEYKSDNHVRVTIAVDEGLPVRVRDVKLGGLEGLPPDVADVVKKASVDSLHRDVVFDEEDFTKTDDAIKKAMTDRGFAYALTARRAEVDLPNHYADVIYEVFPGPEARFGSVRVEGLGNLPEAPVLRAIDIKEGNKYSTQDIADAQQSVLDLGLFSSVVVEPQLPDPPPPNAVVPLVVKIERSKQHQITLGGGVELDPIKSDVHAVVGWEDHNFWGGFRQFRVQFRPGVVLYPTRINALVPPTNPLPEEKLRVELRQPGFLEARTNGVLIAEVNTYPLLLTPDDAKRGPPVLGFFETKGTAGVDRTWWKLYGFPSYNIQTNTPFTYIRDTAPTAPGTVDHTLPTVIISSIDLRAQLDFRDDKIHPHKGLFILNDLQFAGLGGTARDIREQPEVRGYIPVAKKWTLALRGMVGFLFPFNYGKTVNPPEGSLESDLDTEIVFLRGFFSGGPSSNRGYPLRGVGPHGPIAFYSPGVAATQLASDCLPNQGKAIDATRCALPLGGFTIWEASTELRFPIAGALTGATFCDASDVSSRQVDFQFQNGGAALHLSCGLGARYDTPVGPIRLDIGARIPGLNPDFTDPKVVAKEGDPGTFFSTGVPVAVAFGIGEAF